MVITGTGAPRTVSEGSSCGHWAGAGGECSTVPLAITEAVRVAEAAAGGTSRSQFPVPTPTWTPVSNPPGVSCAVQEPWLSQVQFLGQLVGQLQMLMNAAQNKALL